MRFGGTLFPISNNLYLPLFCAFCYFVNHFICQHGNEDWNKLQAPEGNLYPWDLKSTYIQSPPFFENMVGRVFGFVKI